MAKTYHNHQAEKSQPGYCDTCVWTYHGPAPEETGPVWSKGQDYCGLEPYDHPDNERLAAVAEWLGDAETEELCPCWHYWKKK